MRHGRKIAKLSKPKPERDAMFRNLTQSLIKYESIRTTLPKAKALRPFVEKIITKAKVNDLHHKRLVLKSIYDREIMVKLFDEIGPRYNDRPGGYVRIYKLGTRPNDGAQMALIELV